jgi:hypothetical protein
MSPSETVSMATGSASSMGTPASSIKRQALEKIAQVGTHEDRAVERHSLKERTGRPIGSP